MSDYQGFFVMGECRGYIERPWKADPAKFNYRVGIARTYTDQWGQDTSDVIEVEVDQRAKERFRQQAEMLKGKSVMVRVVPMAKAGGRDGAFLRLYAPEDSQLLPQPAQAVPVRQAS